MRLTVKVGLGWSPLDREGVGTPRFWRAVEAMEELGFDSLWLNDITTGPGPAPLPILAAVAARTARLKLGTNVLVVPPRPAMLLAKELATLDLVSGGRFLPAFGLGIDIPGELAALGVPRGERVARLEETIEVIRLLWPGEPVSYEGRFLTLEEVALSPCPVGRFEPWLSGQGPQALRRAGRIADGWLASFVTPEEFGAMVDVIRASAAEAGRVVPEDHYGMIVYAARSEDEAASFRRAIVRRRADLNPEGVVAVGPDGVRTLLERFRAQGATKFVVSPLAPEPGDLLRVLKAEVAEPLEEEGVVRA